MGQGVCAASHSMDRFRWVEHDACSQGTSHTAYTAMPTRAKRKSRKVGPTAPSYGLGREAAVVLRGGSGGGGGGG